MLITGQASLPLSTRCTARGHRDRPSLPNNAQLLLNGEAASHHPTRLSSGNGLASLSPTQGLKPSADELLTIAHPTHSPSVLTISHP
jgi:hypothetical protein